MQKVEYEQCPWDREHVLAIYPVLGRVLADGEWRHAPSRSGFGQYRVWKHQIFQAIYTQEKDELWNEIIAAEPPISVEDAEWTILRESDDSYFIFSKFSPTFGPFRSQHLVNERLQPYALQLRFVDGTLCGVANFASLHSGCWLDAMERLNVLEAMCIRANKAVEDLLSQCWSKSTEDMTAYLDEGRDRELISDIPPHIERSGPKHRTPLF